VCGFLCRKHTCTVTVIHHWTDHRQLIARQASHRSIPGYRPTLVLIAASRRRVHSMRWSQILAQNPDFCVPHVHSTPPLVVVIVVVEIFIHGAVKATVTNAPQSQLNKWVFSSFLNWPTVVSNWRSEAAGCSRVWIQRLERPGHQSLCECAGV